MIPPLPDMPIDSSQPATPPKILAVAVLYRRSIGESESVSSLLRILRARPSLANSFSLIIYDNSPAPQELPAQLPLKAEYVHDGSNGGLAPAYNYALQHAAANGTPWLLLLDQDTTLTEEYVEELIERMTSLDSSPQIGAIVPKLTARDTVYSPESSFLYQMRKQARSLKHPVDMGAVGVQERPMTAYNSGSLVRVAALREVGGFPADFWLDYLDHAVFEELAQRDFQMFVMQASLVQQLSHMDINEVPHWRQRNVLTAQTRYIRRYGTLRDRIMYRLYLLRITRFLWSQCRNREVWKETLLQALLLRVPSIWIGK